MTSSCWTPSQEIAAVSKKLSVVHTTGNPIHLRRSVHVCQVRVIMLATALSLFPSQPTTFVENHAPTPTHPPPTPTHPPPPTPPHPHPHPPKKNYHSIALDPDRRLIWSNGDLIQWRIYAALEEDESKQWHIRKRQHGQQILTTTITITTTTTPTITISINITNIINSSRPNDAYTRRWSNHHWFR